MKQEKIPRYKRKIMTVETVALRKARELRNLGRKEAGVLLGISFKQLEQIENGRVELTPSRIEKILKAYSIDRNQFQLLCENRIGELKKTILKKKEKVIENNRLRRSYKKIISNEVKTLVAMRKMKELSQYGAGQMCGYARCTIGHIENGRIELPRSRIIHIVESYGFSMEDFEYYLKSGRSVVLLRDHCISVIRKLPEEKLKILSSLLSTML